MFKLISFIIIFTLNFLLVSGQNISGKVLTTDKTPIPYATIQIGETHGTITNEEGVFNIKTEGFTEKDIVKISYLGFNTLEVPLNKFTAKDYILEESFEVITEVFLTNKNLSIETILQRVRDSIATNYSNNSIGKVFFRNTSFYTSKKLDFKIAKGSEFSRNQIKTLNNEFNELRKQSENKTSSSYVDILFNYAQLEDSIKINVVNATQLINETKDKSAEKTQNKFIEIISKQLDTGATYKVKTGLFKVQDSLKVGDVFNEKKKNIAQTKQLTYTLKDLTFINSINEDAKFSFIFNDNKNDYVLEGIVNFNGNSVYKISFTPTKKSEKLKGVFYVNTNDFAVVKVDYQLGENRTGAGINLKFLAGFKFKDSKIMGSVIYKKAKSGFYMPHLINYQKEQYLYISRPIKFIKNRNKDDEKYNLKFKFEIEQIANTKDELFFIETQSNSQEKQNEFKNEPEYTVNKIEAYKPEIWKGYDIIEPVKAIKDYHLTE